VNATTGRSDGLDDRHRIIDALNTLAYAFDHREWHRVGEVMAPDVDAYGHQGLQSVIDDSLRRHLGGCGPSQHLLGNYQIRIDGDVATSVTKARVFHRGRDERADRSFEVFGEYHDRWQRTADGWRMTYRRFDNHIVLGDWDVLQPG
jgi:hypothetical protein